MTLAPILALGIVIMIFSSSRFRESIYSEVEEGMQNIAYAVANTYEMFYPGEYEVVSDGEISALRKGAYLLSNDYIDCIKADTGADVTIFYGDIRMLTTLTDENENRLTGTAMNAAIRKQTLEQDTTRFYSNAKIGKTDYFAFYMPLHSAAGNVVGAICVLRPAAEVKRMVFRSVLPILVCSFAGMLIAGYFSTTYSGRIRRAFDRILCFLRAVSDGDLTTEVDDSVIGRKDEIGEMARASASMQRSIRELVERDGLTKLYNRRYANAELKKIDGYAEKRGAHYCIALGDIDYFKKVNDTYGHDAGDKVLVTIAGILEKRMEGHGMVARWGGEEFLFLLERCDQEQAVRHLEQILEEVKDTEILYDGQSIHVTMSFGVVSGTAQETGTAIRNADKCLYYAKNNGRCQVSSNI